MQRGSVKGVQKGGIRPVQRDSIETAKGSSTQNAPNESTKTAGCDSTDQSVKDIVQMPTRLLTAMVRPCRAKLKDNHVAHVGHGVESQDVQGNDVNG